MIPPAYSPLGPRALLAGARTSFWASDPRADLTDVLTSEYRASETLLAGSGTEALRQALEVGLARAGKRGVGTRIALPAFSCYDVATAAVGVNAQLLCYDLNPETLAPDPEGLEKALREGVGVVVIAPLFGLPISWAPVEELVARHGAVLVVDAAQGFGVEDGGRPLGARGELAVLSFGRGKGWTGGGGGALLAHTGSLEGALPERAPSSGARILLGSTAQWMLGRPLVYGIPARLPWLGLGETRYHSPLLPGA